MIMGCASCIKGRLKKAPGCKSKGDGCYGCEKKSTYDWLSNMEESTHKTSDLVEVSFKNGRKIFARNTKGLSLSRGDWVVARPPDTYTRHQVGRVVLQGFLAAMQYEKKKAYVEESSIQLVQRIANEYDMELYEESQEREKEALVLAKQLVKELGLAMHIANVECSADMRRLVFYYTSGKRVNFRGLIGALIKQVKEKVEIRQITPRQEAAFLGGMGSCGRQLCCSTWLTDLKSVPSISATQQNLALNMSRLSGQCGKLKCCLNYELDGYMEAMKNIPSLKRLETSQGTATLQKTDIFQKTMWFTYPNEIKWQPITTKRASDIMSMNEQGTKPFSLFKDENEPTGGEKQKTRLDLLDEKYDPEASNLKTIPSH